MTYIHHCCTIRGSVDTLEEARAAIEAGADGIGLYKLESMFLRPDRIPFVRAIFGASDAASRADAMEDLLPALQEEFEKLFHLLAEQPITIRLLDLPLQAFLPDAHQLASDLASAQSDENWEEYIALGKLRQRTISLLQENPSMGHRGCRLSLTDPELLHLQIRAILQAAATVSRQRFDVVPEIMVPLVASEQEFLGVIRSISEIASEVSVSSGVMSRYKVGALIEVPRAALCAGDIAQHAEFISFGTNDLTQMTFGFSRDDARQYLETYLSQEIFERDPFVSIDQDCVGSLIQSAIQEIRQISPTMVIGICGDHAGDAESLKFFHSLNVDFISCPTASIGKARQMIAIAEEVKLPSEAVCI